MFIIQAANILDNNGPSAWTGSLDGDVDQGSAMLVADVWWIFVLCTSRLQFSGLIRD
jgi:hypothetical protein